MMHTQAKEEQTPHRISMPCFCPSNRGKHLLLAFALLLLFHCLAGNAAAEETLKFGRFGEVTLYRDSPTPANVVLFVSGDGGWNLGVIDMAKSLAGLNALVVGIDIVHYLKETGRSQEKCTYWAADFEELSHYVQKNSICLATCRRPWLAIRPARPWYTPPLPRRLPEPLPARSAWDFVRI